MRPLGKGRAITARDRFVMVDSMRALAALSVLVYHVTFDYGYPHSALAQFLSQRNAGPPVTAVVVFFLISGFVLYRPFVKARFEGRPLPSLRAYGVRRAARIVPAYWVALIGVGLLLGLHYLFTPTGLIRYFGFLQLYGKLSTVSGGISPAWTLCVEVTFYAALPALAMLVRRFGRGRGLLGSELALCAAMVATSLLWQVLVFIAVPQGANAWTSWNFGLLNALPGSLDLFACGMALAIVSVAVERGELRGRWLEVIDRAPWLCWLLAFAVFFAVGKLAPLQSHGQAAWWLPTHELKPIGAALLLAPLVLGEPRRGVIRRVMSWQPLVWLGGVSYAIYLWHKPLLAKLDPHLHSHGELVTTLVLIAVTVAIAAVSWYLIELPAQRMARRWLRGRRAPAGVPAVAVAAPPDIPVS